ncbi:MAG: hypothetical protein ACFFE8_01860 [Candidatus Heimdallarchaeota archaeon]
MILDDLSRNHGLRLNNDPDFLHCCMRCEVATSLGSVDACPQRVHTGYSCCPSCGIFVEHGLESMLTHWNEGSVFMAGFQIVVPLRTAITEAIVRSAFRLEKVPPKQLGLLYEWKHGWTIEISFTHHINWICTIRHNFWPLDMNVSFLRDPLVFGLAGFPSRAGATVFSQLRELFRDVLEWLSTNFQMDPPEFFAVNSNAGNEKISYYASYYLGFETEENMVIDILAPDYESTSDDERCIVNTGLEHIPALSFQKINETLIMQKGLIIQWETIKPTLVNMLNDLSIITSEMRVINPHLTVSRLSQLLDNIQDIQEQFLKIKPTLSSMQGHLSPVVPLLSDPLVQKLMPEFNLELVNSWLDFARSVERSVEGATSYIRGKMNLLALDQEKRVTRRLNLLTALFGSLSGLNLLIAYVSWSNPNPRIELLIFLGGVIMSLIVGTLIFVARISSQD